MNTNTWFYPTTNKATPNDICPICYEDLKNPPSFDGHNVEVVNVKPRMCQHGYHYSCISSLFDEKTNIKDRVCCVCSMSGLPLDVISGSPDEGAPFIRHQAMEAVYQNNIQKLTELLACNPVLKLRFFNNPLIDMNLTLLQTAAIYGRDKIAKLLLKEGTTVDATGKSGLTPLHFAAQNQHIEMVRLLLEAEAKVDGIPDRAEPCGLTPLHFAAQNGYIEVVKLLLGRGANVNATVTNGAQCGCTPLHLAAQNGHSDVVNELLQEGAYENAILFSDQEYGATPLHSAAQNGHSTVVWLLLKSRAIIKDPVMNCNQQRGVTPLHIAALRGHSKLVSQFLKKGVNVNARMFDDSKASSYTPFDLAQANGHEEVCKLIQTHIEALGTPL